MTTIDGLSIEAILLDIDGTIADTDDAIVARVEPLFRFVGWFLKNRDSHVAARRFVMRIESPVNAIVGGLDRLGLDQVLGPITDSLHRLRGIVGHSHARLIPGVKETLIRLAERYPLCVVTAREHYSAHAILESHSLSSMFQYVATARSCRRAKPNPDPVLWAVDQMGANPARCLMVGDTTADIFSGNAAGLQTVGVLCGFGEQSELEEAGADFILDSTTALADMLLGSSPDT